MTTLTQSKYNLQSPYYHTEIRDFYLDTWTPIDIEPSDSDTLVKIHTKYDLRPDLMAYDVYGSAQLWWIFAIRNKDYLVDPVEDFKAGLEIYVPSPKQIR